MAKEAIEKQCNITGHDDLANKLSEAISNGGTYCWREVTGKTLRYGYVEDVYTDFQESAESIIGRFESELLKLHQTHKNALFHMSVLQDNKELAQKFVDLGADINSMNTHGQTALFHYVTLNEEFGRDETTMITRLLEQGAQPNVKNVETGYTPMTICRTPEIIELLMSEGAVVTIDCNGTTMLHDLALEGNLNLLTLLAPKTDVNIVNNAGQTVLDCAITSNHLSCAQMLVDNGAQCSVDTLQRVHAGNDVAFAVAFRALEDTSAVNARIVALEQDAPYTQQMFASAYSMAEVKAKAASVTDTVIDAAGEFAGAGMGIGPDGAVQIAGAHGALTGEGTEGHGDDLAG